MSSPIILTQDERSLLQSIINDAWQDDAVRSIEGPLIHGILIKLEQASGNLTITLTSQENERLQYMLEVMDELIIPWPIPFIPLSERDGRQIGIVAQIRIKLQEETE